MVEVEHEFKYGERSRLKAGECKHCLLNREILSENKTVAKLHWIASEIGEMKLITGDHLERGAASPLEIHQLTRRQHMATVVRFK